MRSFAFAFIAAALATLGGAIPANSVPGGFASSHTETTDGVESTEVHARATPPSIAGIIISISAEIGPNVDTLAYIDPSNITIAIVASAIDSITDGLATATASLQGLVSQSSDAILRSAESITDGAELTTEQLANIISAELNLIFSSIANVFNIGLTDTLDFPSLGDALAGVLDTIFSLVDDIGVDIVAGVEPYHDVIAAIGSKQLSAVFAKA